MAKLVIPVIPSILIGTILIAGLFAFMPVQKAVTVHDEIIAAINGNFADVFFDLSGIHDWITGGHDDISGKLTEIIAAITSSGGTGIAAAPSFDSFVLVNDVHFSEGFLVLLDVHRQVHEGFVVFRSSDSNNCADLQVVVTEVDGTILGSEDFVNLSDFDLSDDHAEFCHAHIPSEAGTVFVAIDSDVDDAIIRSNATITTTILSLEGPPTP